MTQKPRGWCAQQILRFAIVSELKTNPNLHRSNRSHPQQEGTNSGVFAPVWLVLPQCEATDLGVFDVCHCDLLKRECANSGGFGSSPT